MLPAARASGKDGLRRTITPQARSAGRITDPTLLPYKGNGFLLSGIELDTGNDGTAEYRQVWLVIPVEQGGP